MNKTCLNCPLSTSYPLTLTSFYPSEQITPKLLHHFTPCPWQLKSYLILPPLNKLPPNSYTILPSLAAHLLIHFTPLNNLHPHFYTISPPSAGSCYLILPSEQNTPPHSYITLPPIHKLPPTPHPPPPPYNKMGGFEEGHSTRVPHFCYYPSPIFISSNVF